MKYGYWVAVLFLYLGCSIKNDGDVNIQKLKISENGRYLVSEDGKPFFWLGDTGWLLFSKLNREEAEQYLQHRKDFATS